MKFNQATVEEISVFMVICKITNQPNPINVCQNCIQELDEIKKYGEITGIKDSSILKNDTGAYGFIKDGIPNRVLNRITPFTDLIKASELLSTEFRNNYDNLVKRFNRKMAVIEKKYPRAPNHIKNRATQARVEVVVFLDSIRKLIHQLLILFEKTLKSGNHQL
jgi:hypothetical protein